MTPLERAAQVVGDRLDCGDIIAALFDDPQQAAFDAMLARFDERVEP